MRASVKARCAARALTMALVVASTVCAAAEPAAELAGKALAVAPDGIKPEIATLALASPGKAQRIDSKVYAPRDGYIRFRADYCLMVPAPFSVVWAILTDFGQYPDVFPSFDRIEGLQSSGQISTYRQRTVVRAAGLEFPTESSMLACVEQSGGSKGRIGIISLSDDGNSRGTEGGWYVEALDPRQGKGCLVRYTLSTESRAKFLLQRQIIALSLDASIDDTVEALAGISVRKAQMGLATDSTTGPQPSQ